MTLDIIFSVVQPIPWTAIVRPLESIASEIAPSNHYWVTHMLRVNTSHTSWTLVTLYLGTFCAFILHHRNPSLLWVWATLIP